MPSLDVFNQDPFSTIQLTQAVERTPHLPNGLGALNLFEPEPIRTKNLMVEERKGKLFLIPFSPRGSDGTQRTTEKRTARYFDVPRIMTEDTVTADELQSIRAFGTETELMQVQDEVGRRLSGPTGLLSQIEYTWEYHRLAAVQGKLLDSDGSVKYNFFDEFQIVQAAEVAFNLAAQAANTLRPIINDSIVRPMMRAAQGAWTPTTRIGALCGDQFYDQLTNHVDVIRTFINWSDARDIRNGAQGSAFDSFPFAGIDWINYRGSDDNTTIKIATDKAEFFPIGAPGVFKVAYSPGENFDWVNTPGKPVYVIPVRDLQRNAWWKMEAYSYPLHICTRPEMLLSGRDEA